MKKALLAVGGLALVVTVSACGARPVTGQSSPNDTNDLFGNAQELVRAAAGKTGQTKSSKFTIVEALGQNQVNIHGEARYDGANTAMDMTTDVQGMQIEMRLVDGAVYIKVPDGQDTTPTGGKPWGKIAGDNPVATTFHDVLEKAEQNDPSKVLDQIQRAGTITKSERTTLDGQPVSHYWVDIDIAKAFSEFSAETGLPTDQLNKITSQVKSAPMELWLNGDMLPVQVTEDMTPIVKAAGGPASAQPVTITVKYTDWGAPVDVQAPPADQVGDLQIPTN